MHLPEYLIELAHHTPETKAWVDELPNTLAKYVKQWNLDLAEPYIEHASCSYVVACHSNLHKCEAVLKIGFQHEEALHEADALILLNGDPTVQLLNYDRTSNVFLLEKCIPGTSLKSIPQPDQDIIICGILQTIWATPITQAPFRPLSAMIALWNKEAVAKLDTFPNPELAKKGCELRSKLIESTTQRVFLATDLHGGNVLSAKRQPWLAIDLKPHIGDPTYDLTQHMLNCKDRLYNDPIGLIKRLADLANVDAQRLRQWIAARLLSENNGVHQELGARLMG